MNCLNHPDVAAVAYCQNCGKPLCSACMRTVGGVVYCEPCLAARLSVPPGTVPANLTGLHAHPVLAGLLGFIPGVGAMYNGQFVKALAHVLIFAVFVSLSDRAPSSACWWQRGSFIRCSTRHRRPRRGAMGCRCPIPSVSTIWAPGWG